VTYKTPQPVYKLIVLFSFSLATFQPTFQICEKTGAFVSVPMTQHKGDDNYMDPENFPDIE